MIWWKKTPFAFLLVVTVGILAFADDKPFRIVFGSCLDQNLPQPIWQPMIALKPDVFILTGDNIYADTGDAKILASLYHRLKTKKEFINLTANSAFFAVWDDHDYGQNDAGADFPFKRQSQTAFLNFLNVPADSPRRKRDGIYHSTLIGTEDQKIQIILLDTRFFRDPLSSSKPPYHPTSDLETTILGAEQWTWLEQQLREPARIRLIVSGIQFIPTEHGFEKWGNFPHERERLFKLINETKASGVVFLTGDRHFGELSVELTKGAYPFYDLTASSLNRSMPPQQKLEENRFRVAALTGEDNFGVVEIQWETPERPDVRLQLRNEQGDIRVDKRIKIFDAPATHRQ